MDLNIIMFNADSAESQSVTVLEGAWLKPVDNHVKILFGLTQDKTSNSISTFPGVWLYGCARSWFYLSAGLSQLLLVILKNKQGI